MEIVGENYSDEDESDIYIGEALINVEVELARFLFTLDYGAKVSYVYNPLDYAYNVHKGFVNRFCRTPKELLFLGMNPGPWGMMQTGVPFGEIKTVIEWLGLGCHKVSCPSRYHPSRPIEGLSCTRSEQSGKKFWALAKEISHSRPKRFFRHCFIYNYFPLALLSPSASATNITPAELGKEVRSKLELLCDGALCNVVSLLNTKYILALGRYTEKRAKKALENSISNIPHQVKIIYIPHPSPRNPSSFKNWTETAKQILVEQGLSQYFLL